jgi:hypothetical protein
MSDETVTRPDRAEIRAAFLRAILSVDHLQPRRPPATPPGPNDDNKPPQEPGASPSDSPTRIA